MKALELTIQSEHKRECLDIRAKNPRGIDDRGDKKLFIERLFEIWLYFRRLKTLLFIRP